MDLDDIDPQGGEWGDWVRRAARVDENQANIVKDLRKLGYSVTDLSSVGQGCPDIMVGARALNFLFEIKNPTKPKADRQLTQDQKDFFAEWHGQVRKIETVDEAIRVIQESYQ